jgi:hypothetical protein
MKFLSSFAVIASLIACIHDASADELVTLKSGTTLSGKVSVEGDRVTIKLADSDINVSMSEVKSIGAATSNHDESAQRLLVIALESRLHNSTAEGLVGLLAEAYRKDANDSRIAYWYATCLAEAGFIDAAEKIFNAHRKEIELNYPGIADRLSNQILQGRELGKLPLKLRDKINQLNAAAKLPKVGKQAVPSAVWFRIQDSDGNALSRNNFHIECNASQQQLEPFDNNYFLFMFTPYNDNSSPLDCRLHVNGLNFKPTKFEFSTSMEHVVGVGEFVVERFKEEDQVQLTVEVVDPKTKPVREAMVMLRTNNQRGGQEGMGKNTNEDGKVVIDAYPLEYSYNIGAAGYQNASGTWQVTNREGDDNSKRVLLYPNITAKIRLAWKSTTTDHNLQTDHANMLGSGESELLFENGRTAGNFGSQRLQFLQFFQSDDKLLLSDQNGFFVNEGGARSRGWIRKVANTSEDSTDVFEKLDLGKLQELKSKFEVPQTVTSRASRRSGVRGVQLKPEEIYAGMINYPDQQTGQISPLAFKFLVEDLSDAESN